MDESGQEAAPVEVPHSQLSPQALRGVIEAFVLREGTDYGTQEYSLQQKVDHVRAQLQRGEAKVMFDPSSESVQIIRASTSRRPPE